MRHSRILNPFRAAKSETLEESERQGKRLINVGHIADFHNCDKIANLSVAPNTIQLASVSPGDYLTSAVAGNSLLEVLER